MFRAISMRSLSAEFIGTALRRKERSPSRGIIYPLHTNGALRSSIAGGRRPISSETSTSLAPPGSEPAPGTAARPAGRRDMCRIVGTGGCRPATPRSREAPGPTRSALSAECIQLFNWISVSSETPLANRPASCRQEQAAVPGRLYDNLSSTAD